MACKYNNASNSRGPYHKGMKMYVIGRTVMKGITWIIAELVRESVERIHNLTNGRCPYFAYKNKGIRKYM